MAARSSAAARPSASRTDPPAKKRALKKTPGAQALSLDRLIHERTRLAIVSALAAGGSRSFADLKRLLQVTDGNLSVHARKLEDAGYVDCTKTFEKRMPKTEYKLTPAGRKALERYLNHMEALISAARK